MLLALWAKEGSTKSVTAPVEIAQASSEANARAIFRSKVYYEDLGADHFLVTTRPVAGGDNVWDDSDAAAVGHETHFAARVQELVRDGVLNSDLSAAINSELVVSRLANGRFAVQPTTTFYALSLLLVDALFTRMQRRSYPELSWTPPALNYLQWNMGPAAFARFLQSADRHRQEPAFQVGGQPITIEQWALHTVPKSNEYGEPRINAIKFLHYVEGYTPIFARAMNLITPGIQDLQDRLARTAEGPIDAGAPIAGAPAPPDAGAPPPDAAPPPPAAPPVVPTVPALLALGFGVPSGVITDPFYRNAEEKRQLGVHHGTRDRHPGIDVSLNNNSGGGADDLRRGLPVFAMVRRAIDLAELNAARVDNNGTAQIGLDIRGAGQATLQNARVRVQPWLPEDANSYGGVLGLACCYAYTRDDGTPGLFTLYVEYLHLITPTFLPKDGSGRIITAVEWEATRKGIGFGPRMQNDAVLSAADLTGGAPLLVGYLGATQFPHVHIQVRYADGQVVPSRRSPRLDPTVVIT